MLKLKAKKRGEKSKAESLRNEGLIPAVIYGPKQEAISISVKEPEFKKVYEKAGESTIVSVDIDGEEHDTLVQDVQYDSVSGNIIHADLYAIERGKKLQVSVELVFEGLAPAEKNLGAFIVKVMHEIEVECLPRDLPSELKIDLTKIIDLESQIHVRDIELPAGVELVTSPDEAVVIAKAAKEEEIDAPVEAPDMDSIEVEKKGKGEESPDMDSKDKE